MARTPRLLKKHELRMQRTGARFANLRTSGVLSGVDGQMRSGQRTP